MGRTMRGLPAVISAVPSRGSDTRLGEGLYARERRGMLAAPICTAAPSRSGREGVMELSPFLSTRGRRGGPGC
jgi:hypothetical protein